MIYRPMTDDEAIASGLWWSSNPYEDVSPSNPHAKMDLDWFSVTPLSEKNKEIVSDNWAVARGKLERLGDVFQSFSSYDVVVSERVHDAIQSLEPRKHDLVPIPRMWSLGSQKPVTAKYFFLNVYETVRTVDLEKSDLFKDETKKGGIKFTRLDSMTPESCWVYESASVGRHLWRDDVTLAAFMSDTLVDRLKEVGVRGFRFMECSIADA